MRKQRKIQLTIKANSAADGYLPTWGVWEGIREIVQNAKDAETQFNAPMSIEWYNGANNKEYLRITNEGCNLDREALLFGHTTKFNDDSTIGQYGEGLKLGILVLIRAGLKVKIFTGNDSDCSGEVWIPTIEKSDVFNANVLTINIKDAKYRKRVRVEIEGLSKEEWNGFEKNFLFVNKNNTNIIKTSHGEILKNDEYQGKIYVKGIWVENRNTEFGYNFYNADLDRDRKMVDWYSFDTNVSKILNEAVTNKQFSSHKLFSMLEVSAKDTSGFSFHGYLSDDVIENIKENFISKYGAGSIPVETNEQAAALAHLTHNKGIVVSRALHKILTKTFGEFDKIKESLHSKIEKIYSLNELTKEEHDNYVWALGVFNLALAKLEKPKMSLYSAQIVDFNGDKLYGQYFDHTVKLSKSIFYDRTLILRVLIHEYAHEFGDDGEKSHVSSIEKLWQTVFETLTNGV